MSRQASAHGVPLKLCVRASGGYWVRRADNSRTLGTIALVRSRWDWETTPNAFRGDGRPESAHDGYATDIVPLELATSGRAPTQGDACLDLVGYLFDKRAPVLGFGPHPQVSARGKAPSWAP